MTGPELDGESHGAIDVIADDDVCRVVLRGEIDGARRDEASAALATVVAADVPVLVETDAVTFIDSSGVAFLVQLCMVGEEGVTVRFGEPAPVVLDVLEMLELTERFGLPSRTDGTLVDLAAAEPLTSLAS